MTYVAWNDGYDLRASSMSCWDDGTSLYHYGTQGMKWGVRRFQNPDGSLTSEGKARGGYPLNGRPLARPVSNKLANRLARKKPKDENKPQRKGLSDGAKKALKVAGAAALTGAAAYGVYKGAKALKNMDPIDRKVALENLNDMKQGAKNAVKNAGQNVKDAANNAKQKMQNTAERAKNKVNEKVQGAKQKVLDKARTKAEENWNAKVNQEVGKQLGVKNNAKEKIKGLKKDIRNMDKRYQEMLSDAKNTDKDSQYRDVNGRGLAEGYLYKNYIGQRDQAESYKKFFEAQAKEADRVLDILAKNNATLDYARDKYLSDNAGDLGKAIKALVGGVADLTLDDLTKKRRNA